MSFPLWSLCNEQFEINPVTREVRSVWSNDAVSCSSSIPVVTDEDILYGLDKRPSTTPFSLSKYTIEAMDWNTGRSLFHVELSHSLLTNALYAATEIGTSRDVVMGTLGGLIRVASAASDSREERFRRKSSFAGHWILHEATTAEKEELEIRSAFFFSLPSFLVIAV